ncbi:MAG: hypothetical protein PWR29_1520 [Methanolobus sp.]|nr:hypothetical protein [Methanolobus sp.]
MPWDVLTWLIMLPVIHTTATVNEEKSVHMINNINQINVFNQQYLKIDPYHLHKKGISKLIKQTVFSLHATIWI